MYRHFFWFLELVLGIWLEVQLGRLGCKRKCRRRDKGISAKLFLRLSLRQCQFSLWFKYSGGNRIHDIRKFFNRKTDSSQSWRKSFGTQPIQFQTGVKSGHEKICQVKNMCQFKILQACKLPHQTGLPPDFSLECSIQSRLGAIQQHPFFGSGYTRVDNLPGE